MGVSNRRVSSGHSVGVEHSDRAAVAREGTCKVCRDIALAYAPLPLITAIVRRTPASPLRLLDQDPHAAPAVADRLAGVRRTIAVMSGKGA